MVNFGLVFFFSSSTYNCGIATASLSIMRAAEGGKDKCLGGFWMHFLVYVVPNTTQIQ